MADNQVEAWGITLMWHLEMRSTTFRTSRTKMKAMLLREGDPTTWHIRSQSPILPSKYIVSKLKLPARHGQAASKFSNVYTFHAADEANGEYRLTVESRRQPSSLDPILPSRMRSLELSIAATTSKGILKELREAIANAKQVPKLNDAFVRRQLKAFYNNPEYALSYLKQEPRILTFDAVTADLSAYLKRLEEYAANPPPLKRMIITIAGPPIMIEEQLDLARNLELTLMPECMDKRFKISREPGEDGLFDQLAGALPEGYQGDSIVVAYRDLLALGEVFTVGEVNELNTRFVPA